MSTPPDYASYSKEQLESILKRIDQEQFPDRVAELKKRLLEGDYLQTQTSSKQDRLEALTYAPLLRKCGTILAVAGIIDVLITYFALLSKGSWNISILPILVGIYLTKNGRKFALFVRWCSYFGVTMLIMLLTLSYAFIQPMDLTLTQIRLQPVSMLSTFAYQLVWIGILVWLAKALSIPEITTLNSTPNTLKWIAQKPIPLGAFFSALILSVLMWFLNGTTAKHAMDIAQKVYGQEFQYYVSHLSVTHRDDRKYIKAQVIMWNKDKINSELVSWHE